MLNFIPSSPAARSLILADAALRLGPRAVGLWAWHRASRGRAGRALRDAAPPAGPFLPTGQVAAAPILQDAVLEAAASLPRSPDWHGPFDPALPALGMDLFGPGDVRPVWERNRFGDVLLLAQAARLAPGADHAGRADALLGHWCRANPPFRGPAWACGQEAALRALNLVLALALLDGDRRLPDGARGLLALLARRIAVTRAYAAAQDNNHPISEAAGAWATALLLGRPADAAREAARLSRSVGRLVAPDGGFAQLSPGYARLALDTLSVVEWVRRRHAAPPFPAPLSARATALGGWLFRLADPDSGRAPRLGLEDDSALADLSLAGPRDVRASLERAARLFTGRSAGWSGDPGCLWLGLPCPAGAPAWPRPARWVAGGLVGIAEGRAAAVLRAGPIRFRPGQADALHLTLRDGPLEVLRDGGTGAYNPPESWWWPALSGAAGHNGVVFDGAEPMPRATRFLLARWPRVRPLADGAESRDARGNRQQRQVTAQGRTWTVVDRLAGPFRHVSARWRLADLPWRLDGDGVVSAAARIAVAADAPVLVRLVAGWESPSYSVVRPAPVLLVEAAAPVSCMRLVITLAKNQRLRNSEIEITYL